MVLKLKLKLNSWHKSRRRQIYNGKSIRREFHLKKSSLLLCITLEMMSGKLMSLLTFNLSISKISSSLSFATLNPFCLMHPLSASSQYHFFLDTMYSYKCRAPQLNYIFHLIFNNSGGKVELNAFYYHSTGIRSTSLTPRSCKIHFQALGMDW